MNSFCHIWIIFWLLSSALASAETPTKTQQQQIVQNPIDPAKYKALKLDNGIKVVLISDFGAPELIMTLDVGSSSDPDDYQGLAHFLEHMLHLGTQSYPEPNAYLNFVENNGGGRRAFTTATQTQYQLYIPEAFLPEALSRFSELFSSPLFNLKMVDKELSAITAEWQRNKDTLGYNFYQADAANQPENSLFSKFLLGNRDVLMANGKEVLQGQLQQFFTKHYISNNMSLVIKADYSIKRLTKWAKQYFGHISKSQTPAILDQLPAVNSLEGVDLYAGFRQKHIFLQAPIEQPQLRFQFHLLQPLAFQSQAAEILKLIFNDRFKNSLVGSWQEQGLLVNTEVRVGPSLTPKNGQLLFNFTLSAKGSKNQQQMATEFFAYLNELNLALTDLSYLNRLKKEVLASEYVMSKSADIGWLLRHVASENLLLRDPYKTDIKTIVDFLRPENVRIWHVANGEKLTNQLTWASGTYNISDITGKELQVITKHKNIFKLPLFETPVTHPESEQEPQIDFNQLTAVEAYMQPKIVSAHSGIRAFLSHGTAMWSVGRIELTLLNPTKTSNIEGLIYGNLAQLLLRKQLQQLFDQKCNSSILNNCTSWLRIDSQGKLSISISGGFENTPMHLNFINSTLTNYLMSSFSEDDYEGALSLFINHLNKKRNVFAQSWLALQSELSHPDLIFTKKQKLLATDNLSFKGFSSYLERLKTGNFIDAFYSGYYPEDLLVKHISQLSKVLSNYKPSEKRVATHQSKPRLTGQKQLAITSSSAGNGLLKTYVLQDKNVRNRIMLNIIYQYVKTEFFNNQRTDLQQGYLVDAKVEELDHLLLLYFFVESYNEDSAAIDESVLAFTRNFYQKLKKLGDKQFQGFLTKAKSKYESEYDDEASQAPFVLNDWKQNNIAFNSHKKYKQMTQITLADVVTFYQESILSNQAVSRTILVNGDTQ